MSSGNIQVILYRDFFINEEKKLKQVLVANVSDSLTLYSKINEILDAVDENERYNVHYSLAYCADVDKEKGIPLRTFLAQDIVPIDLDGIDLDKKEEYIDIVIRTLGIDRAKTGIYCSGNGLHLIVRLPHRIESFDQFKELRYNYVAMCGEINQEIFNSGLIGNADTQRWSASATLRLPNTTNKKDGKPDTQAYVIQGNVEPQNLELTKFGEDEVEEIKFRKVDTQAVLTGCEFLKWCVNNQSSVKEPQWYAMIGILAYVPDIGKQLCHDYSKEHPSYDHNTTEAKYNQAKELGKPRLCDSVARVFDCKTCSNYGLCKTPLQLKDKSFIATEDTGFHTPKVKDGVITGYTPCYDDMLLFLLKNFDYVFEPKSKAFYIWNGKHWTEKPLKFLHKFCTDHFIPTASNKMRLEFEGLATARNHVPENFFSDKSHGLINFNNGVLRLKDRKLLPHSKAYGFMNVLPYDYDPEAKCPEFDRMMDNITNSDESMKQVILEYMGYCISGMPSSWGQKAMIITGPGGTGKSTFLDILRSMVGNDGYSSVPLEEFRNATMRGNMYGKLFNVTEETKYNSLRDSTEFKNIVTGGSVVIKYLWREPFTTELNTKLILACNEIPPTGDKTDATYRRLIIVPFIRKFYDKNNEDNVERDIRERVKREMSGVYNKVLSALDVLTKQNMFSRSRASDQALAEYQDENDVLKCFINDHVMEADKSFFIKSRTLYATYKDWCHENNIREVHSSIGFGRKIARYLGQTKVTRDGEATTRIYEGYRIINPRLGGADF